MKHERESVAKRLALAALMGTAIHASIPLPLGTQTLTGQQRDTTLVVMLGTGTPRPLPDASGPATAIVVGTRVFLVDACSGGGRAAPGGGGRPAPVRVGRRPAGPLRGGAGRAAGIVVGTRVFWVGGGSGVGPRLAAANLPING